jgi:predicted GIY-YIG superfamily endonuclease
MTYYVYMLRCIDDSIYTGKTRDLDWRYVQHQEGFGGDYTSRRRPVILIWSADFPTEHEAFLVERQIKGWTHAKKEALVRGDFELIHELAKSTARKKRDFKAR